MNGFIGAIVGVGVLLAGAAAANHFLPPCDKEHGCYIYNDKTTVTYEDYYYTQTPPAAERK